MSGRTFIFREDWFEFLGDLNEKQQEHVIHCVWCYAFGQELPKLSQIERIAFNCIKGTVDRDMEKYEERRKKNQENGRKGGRPRSSKTQNNPEKPFGFENNQMVSEVSRSVCNNNPIPISSNAIKGITAFPPSLSSPVPGDGEEEKEKILSEFFFRNLAEPEKEVGIFLAYNNEDGRDWSRLSPERKAQSVQKWQQHPKRPARFPVDFLGMWRNLYEEARAIGMPPAARMLLLSDRISVQIGARKVVLYCSQLTQALIESHLDRFQPVIWPYVTKNKCEMLTYQIE